VDQTTDETRQLVADLFETMYAAKGVGLAANQIGALDRVAVVDVGDGEPIALINPTIVGESGQDADEEGCLSIPDLQGEVARAWTVDVEALNEEGEKIQVHAEGLKARALQHEIDHLDGILFIDRVSPVRRRLLLAKWRRLRKGEKGHLLEVVPETQES
jgi:peptide deformylase